MSSLQIKTALKVVSAWIITLGFVALLTIIFSFLGTLFCSALGGMMMGATKASRKLSISFSVLCPGVLMLTLRWQKSELPDRQLVVLAFLCLTIFWVLYLISRFLIACEKKESSAAVTVAAEQADAIVKRSEDLVPGHVPVRNLQPEELDGKWSSEICEAEGHLQKRVLEIKALALALNTLDAQGRVCSRAQGCAKLMDSTEAHAMNLTAGAEL